MLYQNKRFIYLLILPISTMEKPIFIRMLGDTPKVRILNYLIKYRGLDFSMSDTARNSGVGWATLSRLWPSFIKLKIVILTREIGKAKLYKLNEDNPAVRELIELYKKLIVQETENYFSEKVCVSL